MRANGLATAVLDAAARGTQVLGICGGYQMLARVIDDEVESRAGRIDALGLLPVDVRFATEKTLARTPGSALGEDVDGYEIHHGVAAVDGGEPFLDGCADGNVRGTTWHGIFDRDGFRRAFLRDLAARTGRSFVGSGDVSFAAVREARYDQLADLIEAHVDTDSLLELIEHGAPADLPVVTTSLG